MKKPYKCPFCWNRYGYQHSRALHIEEDHKNVTYNGAKISSLPGDRLAQLDFKITEIAYNTLNENSEDKNNQINSRIAIRLEQPSTTINRVDRNENKIRIRQGNDIRFVPYQNSSGSKRYQPVLQRIYPILSMSNSGDSASPSPPSSVASSSPFSSPDSGNSSPIRNQNGSTDSSANYQQSAEWLAIKDRIYSDSQIMRDNSARKPKTSDLSGASTRASVIVQNPFYNTDVL